MARENARRHHVDERAHFMVSDMAEAVSGRFDVVVSNPPYIATPDLAGLDAEVRVFDPVRALDGGADGLDFYRRLATDSRRLLKPSGTLAVEIGQGQEQDVAHLLCENGFNLLPFVADYAGIIRIIVAQAPFLVK